MDIEWQDGVRKQQRGKTMNEKDNETEEERKKRNKASLEWAEARPSAAERAKVPSVGEMLENEGKVLYVTYRQGGPVCIVGNFSVIGLGEREIREHYPTLAKAFERLGV